MHSTFLAACVIVLSACAPSRPAGPAPAGDDVDAILAALSTRDKVAQLVVPWIGGTYAALDDAEFARVVTWVDSLHVGGVLVSVGSPLDIAAKLNHLQRRSPLPLLVTSDLESGTSFRLTGGTTFPPNMGVGAGGREQDAYEIGRVTALEGRAVGIHMTFSPVADVNSNPANPIINLRSFGEDPHAVARLVAAAVRGIQEHGMLAAVKHFPGHGDTDIDSHLDLPRSDATWARLDSLELLPFRSAIAAGVAGVMSAHIALPALDSSLGRPGTLSPAILTGLLRDSLGFQGLSITDALNMGSLLKHFSSADAAVGALSAGADVLLQPADPAATIDAVVAAVESGRVSMGRLDHSVRKLLEIKRHLGLFRRRGVVLDSVAVVVGRADFQASARDIAARGIVLALDRDGVIDSLRSRPQPLALVSFGDDRSPMAGARLAAELRARGYTVAPFRLSAASGPASYDSARAVLASAPVAVFAVGVRPYPWHITGITLPEALAGLIDSTARARPTALVSLGTPYLIMQTPSVGSYLLGWATDPVSEQAVARALTGDAITGRSPIRIPPRLPLGAGLQRTGRTPAAPP